LREGTEEREDEHRIDKDVVTTGQDERTIKYHTADRKGTVGKKDKDNIS